MEAINHPLEEITQIYNIPLQPLIYKAQDVHNKNFYNEIELCKLISVKTGGCPEDCNYCSQSIHSNSEIKINPLLPLEEIRQIAKQAKQTKVKRICMGAAYSKPNTSALNKIAEYIKVVKEFGLETCATLGKLDIDQAQFLKDAGLDYYNHNIDTSPEYYSKIISTRSFAERIETIQHIYKVGIKVCCGGIIGLGESRQDRISFLHALTQLPKAPESIPINLLVKIKGTKLSHAQPIDKIELIRVIATTRILFPDSKIRLSAGRVELTELEQVLCFTAGANSIFYGEQLLTTPNNNTNQDQDLLNKIGAKF